MKYAFYTFKELSICDTTLYNEFVFGTYIVINSYLTNVGFSTKYKTHEHSTMILSGGHPFSTFHNIVIVKK